MVDSERDQKLLDYNPTFIVSSTSNASDFLHSEKRKLIHEQPIEQQKKLLMKAVLYNDENYIYEFDKQTKQKRKEIINKSFGLGMAFFGYYSFSNYFFWRKIKPIKQMKIEFKFLYLIALNMFPLAYFGYEVSNMYYDLDNFLFNKYLRNNLPHK